jgi:hypothetical protein
VESCCGASIVVALGGVWMFEGQGSGIMEAEPLSLVHCLLGFAQYNQRRPDNGDLAEG